MIWAAGLVFFPLSVLSLFFVHSPEMSMSGRLESVFVRIGVVSVKDVSFPSAWCENVLQQTKNVTAVLFTF